MNKRRVKISIVLLFFIFLIVDVVIAAFIFSSTVRDNDPDWKFEHEDDILVMDYSGGGDAFVYGIGNNVYFHNMFNPNPSRMYTLDSIVKELLVSDNIKSLIAIDAENNYYFFRYGGGPEELDLIYKVPFEESVKLGGFIVLGKTTLTTRILVYSNDSIFIFSSGSTEPLWSWTFESTISTATMSHYGDNLIVGTESGKLYFFRTFEESLIWQCDCDSNITTLAASPFSQYILVGTSRGSLYLYNLVDQGLIWKKTLDSKIDEVYLRSSATESLALDDQGIMYLFDRDGEEIKKIMDVDNCNLSYWGDFICYQKDKDFLKLRESRSAADWKYKTEDDIRQIDTDYGSNLVILTHKNGLMAFIEEQLLLMGSRAYWSGLALLALVQLFIIGYLFYSLKGVIYTVIRNREFVEFIIGAAGGLLAVLVLSRASGNLESIHIVIGMVSAGLASWQSSRSGGGLVGVFSGYIFGLFGSVAIGGAFGIYYWLGGLEENIFSSFLGTALFGGLLGAFYSIVGIVLGIAVKDYFEEYRRKKNI